MTGQPVIPIGAPVGAGSISDKFYYHRTPGAKFYMPDGRELAFAGGELRLSSIPAAFRAAVQKELDAVANNPTSHIFTKVSGSKGGVPAIEEGMVSSEIMSTATAGFDADKRIVGNPPTVPIPQGKPEAPTLAAAGLAAQAQAAREQIAASGAAKSPEVKK